MTLGEFSVAVGSTPRWVQNARTVLGLRARYTIEPARRLSLARALCEACDMPLVEAFPLAGQALRTWPRKRCWERSSPDGAVVVTVDLERFLSTFTTRLSLSRTVYAARKRGRPRKRGPRGIALARDQGLDIALLESSLRRTPRERLESLDRDVAFLRSLRVIRR